MKYEEFLEGEQLLVYQGALFSMECYVLAQTSPHLSERKC